MYKILFARIKGNCWLFNLLVNINLTRALITYAYLLVPIQWMPNKWFIYTQKIQLINWDFLWHTLSENRDVYCIIMWKFDIGVFHVCTMLSCKYLYIYIYIEREREREMKQINQKLNISYVILTLLTYLLLYSYVYMFLQISIGVYIRRMRPATSVAATWVTIATYWLPLCASDKN